MAVVDRRRHVLATALVVFARHGYRRTSMDAVAAAADISRPGLYLWFSSKPELFRAAVEHSLEESIAAAHRALTEPTRPLRERLIAAFDHWSGCRVGPLVREIDPLIEANPGLLDTLPATYSARFRELVVAALTGAGPAGITPAQVAATLISTAAGIKHEALSREEFGTRMTTAVDLYLAGCAPA